MDGSGPAAAVGNRLNGQAAPAYSDATGQLIALLVPALMFLEVKIGGRLFLSEILLAGMLPWLFKVRSHLLAGAMQRRFFQLALFWLLAQMISDLVCDTPFVDWSRGWAKIIFLVINFTAIYLLLANRVERYFMFAAGIALGQIMAYFFNPNVFAAGLPWKFGYGHALTLLVILVASRLSLAQAGRLVPAAAMLGMGLINFYMGFRSLGLICLLGGLVLVTRTSQASGLKAMVKFTTLIGLTMVAVMSIYSLAASHGYFGEKEQQRYARQSAGAAGVLVGGRSEILASSQAVMDSPIIGHGSWAKDPKYVQIMNDKLEKLGYQDKALSDSDLIPSHSYLMGAWVEAGVVGAIFWLFALYVTVRGLIASYSIHFYILPLILFEAFSFLWDIPFSPFGAEARLYAAFTLALMIFSLRLARESEAAGERR